MRAHDWERVPPRVQVLSSIWRCLRCGTKALTVPYPGLEDDPGVRKIPDCDLAVVKEVMES